MGHTTWRVKTALDEVRMLILADQILLGFETKSAFEPGFQRLPHADQAMLLGSLGLQTVIVGLTLLPTVRHQFVDRGHATPGIQKTTRAIAAAVLALFAVAAGVDFSVAATRVLGERAAWGVGLGLGAFALLAWFGVEWLATRLIPRKPEELQMATTPLEDRVSQVLTECRIALPGAQALLGFQLVTMLMDRFEKLPAPAKVAHLSSTLLVGLSTVLLVAPAAFHRMVERGEPTERFERIAAGLLLSALVPLGAGLAGDLGVVFFAVTGSVRLGLWTAVLAAATFALIWGVVPALMRRHAGPREASLVQRRTPARA